MMGRIYSFTAPDGSLDIPVSDGDFVVGGMSPSHTFGECYVQFFDESGDPVAPGAGTVTFYGAAMPGQFIESPSGEVNAADCGPDAAYTPPSFGSVVQASKMKLSGVTGAATCRAFHWRGE